MTRTFTDRSNLNLWLTVAFIVGIGVSLYQIYSLPVSLRLADGYQPEFLSVYLVLGATFLIGILTVVSAMSYKKEVIVFRDKIIDKEELRKEANEQAGLTTISLETVRSALAGKDSKDALTDALQMICKEVKAGQGILYRTRETEGKRFVELYAGYALNIGESSVIQYEFGEGVVGQVAVSRTTLFIDEVPSGYITILSGLGNSSPRYIILVPVRDDDTLFGVLEIATFERITDDQRKFIEESAQLITEKIRSIG